MSVYAYTADGQSSAAGQSESGDVSTNSQNVSATNSTVNVTDFGSVNSAFNFATDSLGKVLGSLNSSQQNQKEIFAGTVEAATKPFAEATAAASGNSVKVMQFAVMAVIGLVLFRAVKG